MAAKLVQPPRCGALAAGGSVGVDFLVMLSAFCLFLPWANAAAQGRPLPQTRPAEFYRRRAARLLPAYYASLLFSLALAVYRSGWSRHWQLTYSHI